MASSPGYYRFPTLAKDRIVFVSEDDLWQVPVSGGIPRRLSSGLGKVQSPALSPDGEWLAFSSTEEGASEIYLMPGDGGSPERLTYLGQQAVVTGFAPDGNLCFASGHQHPFGILEIYKMDVGTREIRKLPTGPGVHVSFGPEGGMVLARHGLNTRSGELAYWKRYRGGTAGEIWIDRQGKGDFKKLVDLPGNTARPYWVGDRVFFLSDHEGVGNVYSVDLAGGGLRRHTQHRDYYVRGIQADGSRFVYHSGADLYLLDTKGSEPPRKIEIDYRSPRTQLNRKFVSGRRYLEDFELHPKAERAVISARGKTFSFDLWKGPVFQHGQDGALRYRLGRFMNDGNRVLVISDEGGEESIEIHDAQNRGVFRRLSDLHLGRTVEIKLSPNRDEAAIVNHRNELVWVDLEKGEAKVLDRSEFAPISGYNWSHDGRYIAYSRSATERTSAIFICEVATGRVHRATKPLLRDVSPFFDPCGEYLYFLSYREFDPVYDNLHFDLGFPRGCRPHLVTLRKDVLSPFSADYRGRGKSDEADREKKAGLAPVARRESTAAADGETDGGADRAGEAGEPKAAASSEAKEPAQGLVIDFEGLEDRIVAFPVPDGRYRGLSANRDKVFFARLPIEGSLKQSWYSTEPAAKAILEMYDFQEDRTETLINGITSFRLSQDGKFLMYRAGNDVRVIKAGEKPKSEDGYGKKSGWLDIDRVQIPVQPQAEWRQMYREAWRLQRDHFWAENMSNVDWPKVHDRYLPLIERLSTRSEFSDLLWEVQGELGTSHAYEMGGDYRPGPSYAVGFLGADWEFDSAAGAWRLTHVVKGDLWDKKASSPLAQAGVALAPGDFLVGIDGQALGRDTRPEQLLVHKSGKDVSLAVRRRGEEGTRVVSVRTLKSEQPARYRDWVENNRRLVHERSGGRVGYLHIPDMGPHGYAEFHRGFLVELDRDGLIVDVRFNGGGHVSQLLLEKLARRRIGYCKTRWFGVYPFPEEAPAGPMVAITNEYAGSDGDIFSHSFKLLGLGPLVGKRTWGGVIGISPSHALMDGSLTTQPEYSFWFEDVGWQVENYGTDPDHVVEFGPAAHVAGTDPQLEFALQKALELLRAKPPKKPAFDIFPDRSLPDLEF